MTRFKVPRGRGVRPVARVSRTVALVSGLLVVLVGCGGGSDATTPAPPSSADATAAVQAYLTAGDHADCSGMQQTSTAAYFEGHARCKDGEPIDPGAGLANYGWEIVHDAAEAEVDGDTATVHVDSTYTFKYPEEDHTDYDLVVEDGRWKVSGAHASR